MNKYLTPRYRLGLSLFVGMLSVVVMSGVMKSEKKKMENQFQKGTVLIAKKYIPQGKLVTLDAVQETEAPVLYMQPTALAKAGDLRGENGKYSWRARAGFLEGEQITKSKLWEDGSLMGLSWILQPNQRAVSLRLESQNAVAGLLQPGDWVSVYATIDKTQMILQRVQVLALQDVLWDPGLNNEKKSSPKSMLGESLLVTLGLSAEEVPRITWAADKGRLTLALLSPMEQEISTKE